jgi:pimeloyl-ACP methyl ester carboxylesterase
MATARTTSTGGLCSLAGFAGLLLVIAVAPADCSLATGDGHERVEHATHRIGPPPDSGRAVRMWTFSYTAHNGRQGDAHLVLPAWYGPRNNPPLPLVISPHGRGATGRSNAAFWGNLPAVGRFAVINPDGMGRRLKRFSYGYPGQIDDLANMPDFAVAALPWLRIDRSRIYALGSSMGGQETLLLVARHPRLLAGAAALDSVTDLARRYAQLPLLSCNAECLQRWGKPIGRVFQSAMSREVGGTPTSSRRAYALRSALAQARKIAFSGVPLQVWWSSKDRIVIDQRHQSRALVDEIRHHNPCAPVAAIAGTWQHSREMRATELLPVALSAFGLLPPTMRSLPATARYDPPAPCSAGVRAR